MALTQPAGSCVGTQDPAAFRSFGVLTPERFL